jgi:acyl homoserine lactone synthase
MQVLAIAREAYGAHVDLLTGMHRLRHKVFKDRLGWNVCVVGDMEIDNYDGLGPTYLLVVGDDKTVLGSARLLPTTGPYMLSDTFPELLDGQPVPRSERLIESSRFCVDTERAEELGSAGLNKATFMLLSAVLEWGLHARAEAIVTVTDLRMERILRRAGWGMSRLGEPKKIGITTALAGMLEVSLPLTQRIREAAGLRGPVLTHALAAAA